MTKNSKPTPRVRRAVKITLSVLWWCFVAVAAVLLFSVLRAKFRGEVPKVFGLSVMRIVSGSMEDELSVGDYILVREVEPEKISEGHIISFYSEESSIYGRVNTHRVIDIESKDGKLEFVTRGDANPVNDSVNAKEDKLIGVFVCKLGLLTAFSNATEGNGLFILLAAAMLIIVAFAVLTVIKKEKTEKPKANGKTEKK